MPSQPSKTGWFISQDFSAATSGNQYGDFSETATTTEKLFRLVALGGGEEDNKAFKIAIEDLKLPPDTTVNSYGSFTISVVDAVGNGVLEKFTNLNFNPLSNDFILK